MKNSTGGTNRKYEQAEETISKLDDMSNEINQSQEQKE